VLFVGTRWTYCFQVDGNCTEHTRCTRWTCWFWNPFTNATASTLFFSHHGWTCWFQVDSNCTEHTRCTRWTCWFQNPLLTLLHLTFFFSTIGGRAGFRTDGDLAGQWTHAGDIFICKRPFFETWRQNVPGACSASVKGRERQVPIDLLFTLVEEFYGTWYRSGSFK